MIKSTRKCPHRLAYCLILWKDFLKWESLFSEDSSLCHWEKKKPTAHCTNKHCQCASACYSGQWITHFCGIKGSSFPADTWVEHVDPKQNPTKPSNSTIFKFLERFSHLCASPLPHLEKASTWSVCFLYSDDPIFLSSNYRVDGLEVCLNPNTYLYLPPVPPQADFQLTSFPPSWLLPTLAFPPSL